MRTNCSPSVVRRHTEKLPGQRLFRRRQYAVCWRPACLPFLCLIPKPSGVRGDALTMSAADAPVAGASLPGANKMLAALIVANILCYLDRQFVMVAAEPLRHDLGLGDIQIGMLGGVSYAACFAIAGIPISMIVDRSNRVKIIAVGVAAWSIVTALSGLARNFEQLFAARMLVGIGEAALAPAAYSLIKDYFAKSSVPRATGFFAAGSATGVGLAMLGGGKLLDTFSGIEAEIGLHAWQACFLFFGAIGLPLSLIFLRYRDPRTATDRASPVRETRIEAPAPLLPFVLERRGLYGPLLFGTCLFMMFSGGYFAWAQIFFMRTFGWSAGETGGRFGTCFILFSILGGLLTGMFATIVNRRAGKDRSLRIVVGLFSGLLIVGTAGPLMPNGWLALPLMALVPLFTSGTGAIIPAFVVLNTPARLQGRMSALFFFCMTLTGYGLGPIVYAAFTERVFGDPSRLYLSMAVATPLILVPAIIAVLAALRHERRSVHITGTS